MVFLWWEILAHRGNLCDFMVELYGSLTKIIIASFAFTRDWWDFFEPLKAYDRENSN